MKNLVALKWSRIIFVAVLLNVMIWTFSSNSSFNAITFIPHVSAWGDIVPVDDGDGPGRCPGTKTCTSGGCTTVAPGGECIYFPKDGVSACPTKGC